MKTGKKWTQEEYQAVFAQAQSIVRTGWEGSQTDLWKQAQEVLPVERRYETFSNSFPMMLNRKFKLWRKTGPAKITTKRTRIQLTDQERETLFTEAQRIVRTGQKISQRELWHQAQLVLPPERQRGNIIPTQITALTKEFKQWQKKGPGQKPAAGRRRPGWPRGVHTAHRTPGLPNPVLAFNFCPNCGLDRRTVKFQ